MSCHDMAYETPKVSSCATYSSFSLSSPDTTFAPIASVAPVPVPLHAAMKSTKMRMKTRTSPLTLADKTSLLLRLGGTEGLGERVARPVSLAPLARLSMSERNLMSPQPNRSSWQQLKWPNIKLLFLLAHCLFQSEISSDCFLQIVPPTHTHLTMKIQGTKK